MPKSLQLEELREVFKDPRQHIAIGQITKVAVLTNNSAVRLQVSVFPEQHEIVATMSWNLCSQGAGAYMLPAADDLVLLAFADGDQDQAFVIARLNSKEDELPDDAADGHVVIQAPLLKKLLLTSDLKVGLSTPGADPDQPIPLGTVLSAFLSAFISEFINSPLVGTCAVGPVMLDPTMKLQFIAQKLQYITLAATNILSQVAYTERGGIL